MNGMNKYIIYKVNLIFSLAINIIWANKIYLTLNQMLNK